jgi:hypothetical protein
LITGERIKVSELMMIGELSEKGEKIKYRMWKQHADRMGMRREPTPVRNSSGALFLSG